jgi:hypothetical protein
VETETTVSGGYAVIRDGVTLATFTTEAGAWSHLLRIQGNSVGYAVAHNGYDIIYPNGNGLKGIEAGA